MSRRAWGRRAALAVALVQIGCSGTPLQGQPAVAPPHMPENAAEAAAECLSRPGAASKRSCVGTWLERRPGEALPLAEILVRRPRGADFALALDALRRVPDGPEKVDLLLAVVDGALAARSTQTASEALRALETYAGASRDQALGDRIASLTAAVRAEQGKWNDAYAIYERLASEDEKALEPVAGAVQALQGAGRAKEIPALCRKLFAGGEPERARPLQTLACLRRAAQVPAAISPDESQALGLGALARIRGLRPEELVALAPPGLDLGGTLSHCTSERPYMSPDLVFRLEPKSHVLASAVFMRLAEAEDDRTRRTCWLGLAAHACWVVLGQEPPCAEQRSIGLYLQGLAKENVADTERAFNGLFATKTFHYEQTLVQLEQRKEAARGLFELHLALAYVLADVPSLVRANDVVYTVKYHVEHAEDRWRDAHPDRPFPVELLDRPMARFLRRPVRRPGGR